MALGTSSKPRNDTGNLLLASLAITYVSLVPITKRIYKNEVGTDVIKPGVVCFAEMSQQSKFIQGSDLTCCLSIPRT